MAQIIVAFSEYLNFTYIVTLFDNVFFLHSKNENTYISRLDYHPIPTLLRLKFTVPDMKNQVATARR